MIEDAAWLRRQIEDLTDLNEGTRPSRGRSTTRRSPTCVADQGIIGVEIPIDRIEGKWKVSQNRPEGIAPASSRHCAAGGEQAEMMAALVAERGTIAD